MNKLITITFLVSLLFFAACGEDDQPAEKTPVRIAFAPSAMQGEEPYTLTVTVTGEGMKEMKSETTFTGKQARLEFPAIPSGPNRLFTVEVKDKNGIVLYTGKTTQILTPGIPVAISIPTERMIVPVTVEVKISETWLGKSCPLTVAVTGPLMKKIEAKTNFTGKSTSINLDVPSGSNRTFTVEVTDKNKIVLYTGETTQSLNPGTPVTVQIPMNRTKVPVTVEVTPSGPMPIGAYTVNIIVTGEGMEEMKAETTFTEKNANINFPAIPSGPDRKFTVEVKDERGEILYIGTATQSLIPGTQTTVSIPIIRIQQEVIEVGDGAKMALIPAGEFSMGDHFNEGDGDEKPVHTVYLDDYYIDVYEVTNAQYAKFLNEYGRNTDDAGHKLLGIAFIDCLIEKVGNTYKPKAGYENHPVIVVSWYGAAAYAQFYGKRLPTEAEWEKAARGGLVGKRYPWGDNITHDDANYSGTGGKDKWDRTSPVGSFAPSGYGLYDMAGNIWEWCADEYDSGYYSKSPKNNPKGPGVYVTFKNNDFTNVTSGGVWRVLRGGSWVDNPDYLRAAFRDRVIPGVVYSNYGFRCSYSRFPR